MARKKKRNKLSGVSIKGASNSALSFLVSLSPKSVKGGRKTQASALRELQRRRRQKVGRKKGYINVMGKWVRVD